MIGSFKKDIYNPKVIGGRDVFVHFKNIKHLLITDRDFGVLKREFLLGEGYKGFKKWMGSAKLFKWRHNWDCDNFAAAYKLYMSGVHASANKKNRNSAEGVAVGEVFYITKKDPATGQSGGGHAINVALIPDNEGRYRKMFIEPQSGEEIKLTPAELKSIWYVKF